MVCVCGVCAWCVFVNICVLCVVVIFLSVCVCGARESVGMFMVCWVYVCGRVCAFLLCVVCVFECDFVLF